MSEATEAAAEAPACEPGTMVDHFEVIRLIGKGGMGEVYLAYDTQLGRRVALKMIIGEWLSSDEAVERFLFEVRTTAKFNHPNIVTVYAAGRHEGRPYVALEYLKGQNLRQRMQERPPAPQAALRIMLSVAEALEEAHRHGVLHRDLKPENVIIPLDGRLRVVDFGLAKQVRGVDTHLLETFCDDDAVAPSVRGLALDSARAKGADLRATPRSEAGLKGTPAYMAPEQWLDLECTAAADIWAFGVLLFELCAHRVPYDHENIHQQLTAVCSAEPAPSIQSFAQVPDELASLINRCLDKDASFRPLTAEVAATLRDMLFDTSSAASGKESPFRGLLPFTERHAGLFFGREAEIAAFVERVRHHPVLPVVGPSGAGKSSFVQAGVVPRLREQEPWIVLQLRPGNRPFHALATRLVRRDTWHGRSRHERSMLSQHDTGHGSLDTSAADDLDEELDEDSNDAAINALAPTMISGEAVTQIASQGGDESASARFPERSADDADEASAATGSSIAPPSLTATEVMGVAEELFAAPRKLSLQLRALADQRQARVLLFVDQLEELFTLVDDPATRERFIQALCTAAEDPLDPVRVAFTVRDDFLGRLAVSAEAREALTHVTVVQRLDRSALEQTLIKPVEVAGYGYDDPELVAEMVASVEGEPAGLPLLQFAAQMLWERRNTEQQLLLRSAYRGIGGVEGALAKHADGVLDGLSPDELKIARNLLLRLVTPERTRQVIARRAAIAGLDERTGSGDEGGAPDGPKRVLDRLTVARLVNVSRVRGDEEGDAVLELAHESLIHTWSTLSRWLDEGREELAFLAEVGQAAELWDRRGQRPEELWRGSALEEASRTARRCTTQLPELVSAFLAAGQAKQTRRQRRVRLAVASAISLSVVVAVAATLVALFVSEKEQEAREQRDLAEQREARALEEGARAALGDGRLLEARAKLRAALEKENTASTAARGLWWQLQRNPLVWTKEFGAIVYAVAFSPDGTTVAAACQDRAVYLLDTRTRSERILRGHDDQVLAVDFSPDGKRLATASWNGEIRLWDLPSGEERHLLRGHEAGVRALAFSPNGELLATANFGREIRLWDAQTGAHLHSLTGHEKNVVDVRFSHDGKWLASASADRTVRIWNPNTAEERSRCAVHDETLLAVDFSPDDTLLVSGGRDRTIRIWKRETCEVVAELEGHTAAVTGVRMSPDGRRLMSSGRDATVRLWDVASGSQLRVLRGHDSAIWDLALSSDGSHIASGSADKSLRIWSTTTGDSSQDKAGHTSPVRGASLSTDGKQLASAGLDGTLRLWDVPTGTLTRVLARHKEPLRAVSFSPDGQWLASGGEDRHVRLWEVHSGKERRVLVGHLAAVQSVAFSPDGKRLASGSLDDTVRLWQVDTGELLRVLRGHRSAVGAVQFSPSGELVASAGWDQDIRLWKLAGANDSTVIGGHSAAVWGLSFGPTDRSLASIGLDGAVRLWSAGTHDHRLLGMHPVRGSAIAFHPDGKHVVSAGAGDRATLWSVDAGQPLRLAGHRGDVNTVDISADGRLVATGGDDTTVRVWRAEDRRPYWNAPALFGAPPRLLSHRRWETIGENRGNRGQRSPAEPTKMPGESVRAALEDHARYAHHHDSRTLCLQSFDGSLEVWDLLNDRRVARKTTPGLRRVVATPEACVSLSDDGVALTALSGETVRVATERRAAAIAWSDGAILVATDHQVHQLSAAGQLRASHDVSAGVITALAGFGLGSEPDRADSEHRWLAVGYRDGNIELRFPGQSDSRARYTFEAVSASPPSRMLAGPSHTLIVGYADGLVGIWDLRDGKQLARTKLHGSIAHLVLEEGHLYAASELGEHTTWDLAAFDSTRCELLAEVWSRIPIVWHSGQPLLRQAPEGHGCGATP